MTGPYSPPRPIAGEDDLAQFDSGEPFLDDWLRKRAVTNHATGASRTFVTTREDRVVGFYALATGAVSRIEAPKRVGQGQPDPVPVILLGRLTVDRKEQGHGLGAHLLRDAIIRAVQAAAIIGVQALLVHALHECAKAFYLNFDFDQSPTDELHLVLSMKDARALVSARTQRPLRRPETPD